jgi:predicted ATP-grasp superfamily ATP-dependent carboligase
MDRVLVLDGDARSALAVVRSLGRLGLEIGVAAAREGALAQRSRFASQAFRCPDPAAQPRAFQGWLRAQVESFQPHMLLPLSDLSLGLALELEDELRARTVLPSVDRASFARVADKAALLETAAQLGLRVPRTLHVPPAPERSPEWRAALRAFGYPAVLKANCTQSGLAGRFVRLPVAYPQNAEHALALLEGDAARREVPALLQALLEGPGTGVFALCADGEALALFAHRGRLE